MSDSVIPIVSGVCLGGTFVLSTAAYSLRNFSRSRLQQVCRERQNPQRFGAILKLDEEALLACELLLAVCYTVAVAGLVIWATPQDGFETTSAAVRALVILLGVLFGLI
ncbi:MAG: hypothetical protein KDA75_17525, partial [Planctomycetaceae bacterium]|nr:hypothetical protein [Planctomycetaceae bacterium]